MADSLTMANGLNGAAVCSSKALEVSHSSSETAGMLRPGALCRSNSRELGVRGQDDQDVALLGAGPTHRDNLLGLEVRTTDGRRCRATEHFLRHLSNRIGFSRPATRRAWPESRR